ncbi:MAG: hypothetical protein ACM3TU_00435 [Bacillota bacterium]
MSFGHAAVATAALALLGAFGQSFVSAEGIAAAILFLLSLALILIGLYQEDEASHAHLIVWGLLAWPIVIALGLAAAHQTEGSVFLSALFAGGIAGGVYHLERRYRLERSPLAEAFGIQVVYALALLLASRSADTPLQVAGVSWAITAGIAMILLVPAFVRVLRMKPRSPRHRKRRGILAVLDFVDLPPWAPPNPEASPQA